MSNSGSSNKYNDPTLPGYDPSKPTNSRFSSEPQYTPTPRSSLPPHLRGYFRAPKL